MKQLSCGVLIFKDEKLLMCKVTGQNFWDIPKGLNEVNESPIETAIRELKEETSFKVKRNDLVFLDKFKYNSSKDLIIFKYIGEKEFNSKDGICTSYFINPYTAQELPEVCGFDYFNKEEAIKHSSKSLSKVLKEIL